MDMWTYVEYNVEENIGLSEWRFFYFSKNNYRDKMSKGGMINFS